MLTPGFAPLEQYAARAARGSFTDVYGLGATLYFALTGIAPPAATDRVTGEPLRAARDVVPDCPQDLSTLLDEVLAMGPDRRPPLPRLAERLDLLAHGGPPAPAQSLPTAVPVPPPPSLLPSTISEREALRQQLNALIEARAWPEAYAVGVRLEHLMAVEPPGDERAEKTVAR
jgi:hypothetical protein